MKILNGRFISFILISVFAVISLYSFYHKGMKVPVRSAIGIKETDRRGGDFWGTFPAYFVERYNPALRNKTIVKEWSVGSEWDYGPIQHLVTLPLTFISSIKLAGTIWLIFNYLFLFLALWVMLKILDAAPAMLKTLVVFLWLAYWPLYPALEENVIEIFELFMIIVSLYLFCRNRDILAGIVMGVCGMAKFLPMVFLGYFLVKGRYKAFAAMLATVAVIIIGTQAALGWQNSKMLNKFFNELREERYDYTYWRSQTIPSAVERAFSRSDYSSSQIYYPIVTNPGAVKWIIKFSVGFILLFTFLLLYRTGGGADPRMEYGIVAAMMILVPTHGEHYYLIFGLIGYSVAIYQIGKKRNYFAEAIFAISFLLSGYMMQIREFDRILCPDYTDINREVFFNFLSFPAYGIVLLFILLIGIYLRVSVHTKNTQP